MSEGGKTLTMMVIEDWERMKRFATSLGLTLVLDTKNYKFVITENDAGRRVVSSNLESLDSVRRILSMYHRLSARYGDIREPAHAAAEVHP